MDTAANPFVELLHDTDLLLWVIVTAEVLFIGFLMWGAFCNRKK